MPQMAPMPWVSLMGFTLFGLICWIAVVNFSASIYCEEAYPLAQRSSETWRW